MKKLLILLFITSTSLMAEAQRDFLITAYGAKADGLTLNTKSIQSAIDGAYSQGGGRVVVPQGTFMTGSLYLKDHVELHLQEGATLLGSLNPFDYVKDPYCRWTAMIFAVKQKDISITGMGTIDCRGWEVANRMVQYIHLGLVKDPLRYDRPNETNRPEIIHFRECEEVRVSGVTLRNPASWTQQYDQCSSVVIDHVMVDAKAYWNNDGLDIVDCSNVTITHCDIDAADDAYCFKSHSPEGICQHVRMRDCRGRSSANGIKFGTLTRGIFRDFKIQNNLIYDTYRSAITIASVDGAVVEDILVDSLQSIHTGNPLFIRFSDRRRGNLTPCLRNITISNLYAEVPSGKPDAGYRYEGPVEDQPRNISPSSIVGCQDLRIENVTLKNVTIKYPGGADSSYAYRGSSAEELANIPERRSQYPEFSMWKELPAWGLFIRHADGVKLDNVTLQLEERDYRPAIVADDVNRLSLHGVNIIPTDARKKQQVVANGCSQVKADKLAVKLQKAVSASSKVNKVENIEPLSLAQRQVVLASRYGILSTGTHDNTANIQLALDQLSAQGGGTLRFQVGRYLTGSLTLRPNVDIILEEGAILVCSSNNYNLVNDTFLLSDSTESHCIISGLGKIELPGMLWPSTTVPKLISNPLTATIKVGIINTIRE